MSDFDNIGKLMHLPLADIKSTQSVVEPKSVIVIAAKAILKADGRNWVPVIVQEVADYQYEVVGDGFIYAAAQKAKLERVWCIVINPSVDDIEQVKILQKIDQHRGKPIAPGKRQQPTTNRSTDIVGV